MPPASGPDTGMMAGALGLGGGGASITPSWTHVGVLASVTAHERLSRGHETCPSNLLLTSGPSLPCTLALSPRRTVAPAAALIPPPGHLRDPHVGILVPAQPGRPGGRVPAVQGAAGHHDPDGAPPPLLQHPGRPERQSEVRPSWAPAREGARPPLGQQGGVGVSGPRVGGREPLGAGRERWLRAPPPAPRPSDVGRRSTCGMTGTLRAPTPPSPPPGRPVPEAEHQALNRPRDGAGGASSWGFGSCCARRCPVPGPGLRLQGPAVEEPGEPPRACRGLRVCVSVRVQVCGWVCVHSCL